ESIKRLFEDSNDRSRIQITVQGIKQLFKDSTEQVSKEFRRSFKDSRHQTTVQGL
ncbi:unnamed protein product, partial [Nesidiocoris tenuis]